MGAGQVRGIDRPKRTVTEAAADVVDPLSGFAALEARHFGILEAGEQRVTNPEVA